MNFLNFSDQKLSLAIVLKLVLNFWANVGLVVLIKFMLIKKGRVSINGLLTMKTSTMSA